MPAEKIQPLKFLANTGEVAGRRVARRALSGSLKVGAAVGDVAGGEVRRFDGAPPTAQLRELIHLRMQERDDRVQFRRSKARERRHAGVRAPGAYDGR